MKLSFAPKIPAARLPAIAFIVLYLGTLVYGIGSHLLSVGNNAHVGMYYIVWDMFCGWSGHEQRLHILAEGESGQFYDLTNTPWGDIKPFGARERVHYDSYAIHAPRIAKNILRQTSHEPITKLYLVEECWPKKYNIPDYLWSANYEERKDLLSYYNTRMTLDPQGRPLAEYPNFISKLQNNYFLDNPKLKQLAMTSKPYFVPVTPVRSNSTVPGPIMPVSHEEISAP